MKKQDRVFPLLMLLLSLVLASKAARGQGTVELMCRNKAKEIAAQTYQTCVTEEKTARLTDIKERYRARMMEVKGEFQKELDVLNGKKKTATPDSEAVESAPAATPESAALPVKKPLLKAVRSRKAEKPVVGVAKALPAKRNSNGPALPVQNESNDETQTVVTATVPVGGPELEVVEVSNE